MEVKPGYKQTEVGVVPEDWEVTRFAELFAFRNGVNADKAAYGQGVRFINVLEPITYSHIHGPEITGQVTLPESILKSYTVRRGDVLFNRTSETQEEVALAATYLGTERVVFGGFVIRGRPLAESLDPVYAGYALRAPCIRSQIIPMGQGAVRANVGQQNLGRVLAPIPSLPEQRAIATALGDVDQLLSRLDRLIAKKRDLKQSVVQQLLTGQIRLPGFRGDWERVKLSQLGFAYGGLSGKSKADFDSGNCPYVTFMNVMSNVVIDPAQLGYVRVSSSESQNHVIRGDLLFNGSSETPEEVAMCAYVDCDIPDLYLNSFCFGFRFTDRSKINGSFLASFFRSSQGREIVKSLAQGSTRYNISKPALTSAVLTLPARDEQDAISEVLADIDSEIAFLQDRVTKTKAIKQGMMQQLLTGKVRLV
ncbi:hypothetical protein CCB80_08680 [Armatimonadetes bacterium Uphvl-Ar1]|nr:hypothetical protein CCB80_08680 [Armatimonadetes bacterium Uphvl-Ar1]